MPSGAQNASQAGSKTYDLRFQLPRWTAAQGIREAEALRNNPACVSGLKRGEARTTVWRCYTPAMAKRFNVSIPDALAERMEPFKNDLSLSALMQDAIERELIRLTMSDKDRELRENFKKTAVHAWVSRLHGLGHAVNAFVEHLVDQAAKDSNPKIFELYRALYLSVKHEEIVEALRRQETVSAEKEAGRAVQEDGQTEPSNASKYDDAIHGIICLSDDFSGELTNFINRRAADGDLFFAPDAYLAGANGALRLHDWLEEELMSTANTPLQSFYLDALHSKVSTLMSELEINIYLHDLDLEMLVQGDLG